VASDCEEMELAVIEKRQKKVKGREITLHAQRLIPTVASESGGSGERRVAPGGFVEGEPETVVSGQWSVASESGESGELTQGECPAPQNAPNEANPESTQSSLPLEVESSVPEPPGRKRSQSTQAVASGERRVATGQWPVNAKWGRPR
jgi:hypothetical protein